MLEILESLTKTVVALTSVPVTVAADVVTLGGSLTDRDEPYTATALSSVIANLERAAS